MNHSIRLERAGRARIPNMMYRFHPRNSDPRSVDDHKF